MGKRGVLVVINCDVLGVREEDGSKSSPGLAVNLPALRNLKNPTQHTAHNIM